MKRSSTVCCNHPKTLLVAFLLLFSPLALSGTCKFGGEYVWSEQGKNFVNVGGSIEVVELVEVGHFKAYVHGRNAQASKTVSNGTMTGTSRAVFKLPIVWVNVEITYSEGVFTFDSSNCTGEGSWVCEARLAEPETDNYKSLLPSPLPVEVVRGLVDDLCEVPLSFALVTSEEGRKLDFIITGGPEQLISSGSGTRVRPVAGQ